MVEKNGPEAASGRAGIVAFTDLIFGARIRAAADACRVPSVAVTVADRLVATVRDGVHAVFVDLDVRTADPIALIARLKADECTRHAPVVAFASHIRTDALQAARDAGADRVLARGAFARQLPSLVREFAQVG